MKKIILLLFLFISPLLLESLNIDALTASEEKQFLKSATDLQKMYYKIYPEYRKNIIAQSKMSEQALRKVLSNRDNMKVASEKTRRYHGNQYSIGVYENGTYYFYGIIVNPVIVDDDTFSIIPKASALPNMTGCTSTQSGSGYFTCYGATAFVGSGWFNVEIEFDYTLVNGGYDSIHRGVDVSSGFMVDPHSAYVKYNETASSAAYYKLEFVTVITQVNYTASLMSVYVGNNTLWATFEDTLVIYNDEADLHWIDCDVWGLCPG